MSDSATPLAIYSLWNSPGQNTGVDIVFPFSKGSSQPRDQTQVSRVEGKRRRGGRGCDGYIALPTNGHESSKLWEIVEDREAWHAAVQGILQARVLEWVAISFSRGSSQPRDRIRVSHIVDRRFTV